jgi:beta-galactosidase
MRSRPFHAFGAWAVLLFGGISIGLTSCSISQPGTAAGIEAASQRQRTLLDLDWRFHLGDISPDDQVITVGYDDSPWRRVDLPHDYVLDGKYARSDLTPVRSHGYLPVEVAWYRKHLFIPESDRGRILKLDFDGVFRDSQVWVNGQFLGRHPSGYTPFSYDITHIAKIGGDNVVAVRVDPREFEGHWYEGGGIYRHVYVTALAPLHVAQWGTYVVSKIPGGEQGADGEADLTIQTTIENGAGAPAECEVVSEIVGPDGRSLQTVRATASVAANGNHDAVQHATLDHPKLWSLESPNLYELRTVVLRDGKPVDATTTTFGIRTIAFDPDKGFFLNGRRVEIQGVANHQDMPAVGIAVPDSLQPWRVAKLKAMGCNGWRTAHNMANEAVLDACDRQGMLVMDENRHLGDSYLSHSPPGTQAGDLSDLAALIQRDRNHPSVIMWSLCNEEGLRGKPEGMRLFAQMKDIVYRYDTTRPITSAINGSWIAKGVTDEDILGVNYHYREYDAFRAGNPHVMMFGSETTNEKTTRGEYEANAAAGASTCYNLSEKAWLAIADRLFIAGSYVWTGFDYRGEPNPWGWPDISNNTGLMDVCGFPKDKYYYFEACWSDKPMVHLLPGSWTWPGKEGQDIRVIAFSNAKQVELFLNDRSLGKQDMPHDGHVEWQVPYEPGRLNAKAYTDGKQIATVQIETAAAPARIDLQTDRTALRAGQEDAMVVAVSLLDDHGRLVPNADRRVTFHLTGGGRILGVGNGNPADHDPDRAEDRNTFHGHCIVLIQAGDQPSEINLTAAAPGVTAAEVRFTVR